MTVSHPSRTERIKPTAGRLWRRMLTVSLLGGAVWGGLAWRGKLESSTALAEPPANPAAPVQQPPVQAFTRSMANEQPAAVPADPWAQVAGGGNPFAPAGAATARPLVPPTGIQQAGHQQEVRRPAPVQQAEFQRLVAQDDSPRGLFDGPGPVHEAPSRSPQLGPNTARAPQLMPTGNMEKQPGGETDPFSHGMGGFAGRPLAEGLPQPQLLPGQLPANLDVKIQLDPVVKQVDGMGALPSLGNTPQNRPQQFGSDLEYSPAPVREVQNPKGSPHDRLPPLGNQAGMQPAGLNLDMPALDPMHAPTRSGMMPPNTKPANMQPVPQVKPDDVHEVKSGENFWTISRQYYGSARFFSALAKYNEKRIADPNKMRPGMYVLVPDLEILHQRYPKLTGGGAEAEAARQAANRPGFFLDQNSRPAYRVAKGDTLSDIAQRHLGRSTGAKDIYLLNRDRIPDPNNLALGTVLSLPADASQVAAAPELLNR